MKKILLGLFLNTILVLNVLAGEIETKKVISTGVGLTETDALKDATRNAVQQVVGAYILSDTYSKNSQIIKDNILVNSNGYVKTFNVISQSKDDNGLFRIEAEIEVEVSPVTKRLGELNIALKDVSKVEVKAISLDKIQSVKDFKAMFYEIILKPIKENKKIYDIKIGELKNVEKFPEKLFYSTRSGDSESINKANQGESLPFILSFSVDFDKDYIRSVEDFLKKASSKICYDEEDIRDSFGKILSFRKMNFEHDFPYRYNPKLIRAYKFNDLNTKAYEKLMNDFYLSETNPRLIITFFDSKNDVYKSITCYRDHEEILSDIACGYPQIVDQYQSSYAIFGFSSNSDLSFVTDTKNVNIGMYLSEKDIINIKSTSIEIKF